jgi:hypothetical protein
MPKVDVWPFEAHSQNEKNIRFKPLSLTVRELMIAKDGTSQAGNVYHIPPRLTFEEDKERNEWQWKEWVDSKPIDYPGPFPIAGDVVQATLKVSMKNDGTYWYDIEEVILTGQTGQVNTSSPPEPAGSLIGESALGRLPVEQRIAATALTNVLVPKVWDETPDGDEWKETLREAIKKITLAQIPPTLLPLINVEEVQPAPEPEAEEDVEELQW